MRQLSIAEQYWNAADSAGRSAHPRPVDPFARGYEHGKRIAPLFSPDGRESTISRAQRHAGNTFLSGIAAAFQAYEEVS